MHILGFIDRQSKALKVDASFPVRSIFMTLLIIGTTLFFKRFLGTYCWFGGKDDFLKLILNSTIFLDSYFFLNTFSVGDSFWFST